MDRTAEAADDARRSLALARQIGDPAGELLALAALSLDADYGGSVPGDLTGPTASPPQGGRDACRQVWCGRSETTARVAVPGGAIGVPACPDGGPVRGQSYGTLRGMEAGLRVHQGGSGEPVLLLLHGLGATGDVWQGWRPLLARRWPGRWLAPDLPGHGGSRPLPGYSFESLAAAVADISPGTRTVVLGHSLGGVVGLALAGGGFGVQVQAVIGLGIKVAWTGQELDRVQAAARRPPAWFASREEAAARYLRISGLAGLLPAVGPAVDAGLREQHGRWRLAMDPGAFAVGAPDMARLLAGCQAPVTLARGEHDAMNTDEQLTGLGVPAVSLPGLGHNAHVENPHLSITLLDPHRPACINRPVA